MVQCQCLKGDGKQCTRDASVKPGDNPHFCWQHQKCKNVNGELPVQPGPLQMTAEPVQIKVKPKHMEVEPKHMEVEPKHVEVEPKHVEFEPKHAEVESSYPEVEPSYPEVESTHVEVEIPLPVEIKNIDLIKTKTGKGLWVCGDTKSSKDTLIAMGGKWNASKKCWIFSLKQQQQLLDL
jgi:hypothetical protein